MGVTQSYGAGAEDIYLAEVNNNGVIQWMRTYGSSLNEGGIDVEATSDGGAIIGGWTTSFGALNRDIIIIKVSATGALVWAKKYHVQALKTALPRWG